MRPQQQNRRMRGRNNNGGGSNNNNNNNNNRKGPNPLTRNYESNGPDVKIRGSAQQIAEKYTTLARDSQSSGDRVMAENYLQHAEHYNRIIAAAQAQMPVQQNRFDGDDEGDDEMEAGSSNQGGGNHGNGHHNNGNSHQANGNQQHGQSNQDRSQDDGSGPQPVIDGTPAEVAYNNKQSTQNDGERQPRRERGERSNSEPRAHVANSGQGSEEAPAAASEGSEEDKPARRPRRPRRPRIEAATAETSGEDSPAPGNEAPAREPEPVAATPRRRPKSHRW